MQGNWSLRSYLLFIHHNAGTDQCYTHLTFVGNADSLTNMVHSQLYYIPVTIAWLHRLAIKSSCQPGLAIVFTGGGYLLFSKSIAHSEFCDGCTQSVASECLN